jgi:hypothetical protein
MRRVGGRCMVDDMGCELFRSLGRGFNDSMIRGSFVDSLLR